MSIRPLLTLALACGLATAAAAAEMTGTVVSADEQSITLRHDDGTEMTHRLAPGVELRGSDGGALAPVEITNRRVQIEVDEAARVTSIELADADEAAAQGATAGTEAGRMGDDTGVMPGADPTAEDAAADDDPTMTGGTEERAAQAGDPAAPDPAGGEMARAELPDTAGPVTLVALIGGALLAAAYATRAYRRR
jgi:hypothetical protein